MVPYTHLADAKKESQAHTRDETTDLCASLPPSSKHGNLNNPFWRVGEGYTTSCRVVCVYWMLRGSFLSLGGRYLTHRSAMHSPNILAHLVDVYTAAHNNGLAGPVSPWFLMPRHTYSTHKVIYIFPLQNPSNFFKSLPLFGFHSIASSSLVDG